MRGVLIRMVNLPPGIDVWAVLVVGLVTLPRYLNEVSSQLVPLICGGTQKDDYIGCPDVQALEQRQILWTG